MPVCSCKCTHSLVDRMSVLFTAQGLQHSTAAAVKIDDWLANRENVIRYRTKWPKPSVSKWQSEAVVFTKSALSQWQIELWCCLFAVFYSFAVLSNLMKRTAETAAATAALPLPSHTLSAPLGTREAARNANRFWPQHQQQKQTLFAHKTAQVLSFRSVMVINTDCVLKEKTIPVSAVIIICPNGTAKNAMHAAL